MHAQCRHWADVIETSCWPTFDFWPVPLAVYLYTRTIKHSVLMLCHVTAEIPRFSYGENKIQHYITEVWKPWLLSVYNVGCHGYKLVTMATLVTNKLQQWNAGRKKEELGHLPRYYLWKQRRKYEIRQCEPYCSEQYTN